MPESEMNESKKRKFQGVQVDNSKRKKQEHPFGDVEIADDVKEYFYDNHYYKKINGRWARCNHTAIRDHVFRRLSQVFSFKPHSATPNEFVGDDFHFRLYSTWVNVWYIDSHAMPANEVLHWTFGLNAMALETLIATIVMNK